MKLLTLLPAAAILAFVPACEKKPETTGEKVENAVNDALDRRPAEGLKDAAEDTKDAIKDTAKDTKDAVKDAAGEVKDAVKEATE